MSLQLWLPFNGDLNNQGINDYEINSKNIEYSDFGKIGKCIKFNGNATQYVSIPNMEKYQSNFSWTIWIKPSNTVDNVYQFIMSQGRDYGTYGLNILQRGTGLFLKYGGNISKNIGEINANKWYFVALTVSDTKIFCYINGIKTIEFDKPDKLDYIYATGGIVIGKMSYQYTNLDSHFPFNGYINDVRVYDHCLSTKEIKEISKAKILHYPMRSADGFIGGRNIFGFNKGSVISPLGNGNYSSPVFNSDINGFTITIKQAVTTTNLIICRIQGLGFNSIAGNYTLSGIVNSNNDCTLKFDICDAGNKQIQIKANADTPISITANVTNYYTPEKYNGFTDIEAMNLPLGTVINISNFKIERGTRSTQWTPAPEDFPFLNDTTIYDVSGYMNDGVITSESTIEWDNSSAIGEGSFAFDGKDKITLPDLSYENIDNGTISFWLNIKSFIKWDHYLGICNGFDWTGTTRDFIIFAKRTPGDTSSNPQKFNLDCCSYSIVVTITPNTWNLLSISWDCSNYTIKYYFNGNLIATVDDSTNKRLDTYRSCHSIHSIGSFANNDLDASIQDLRIYASTLLYADIKELYQTRYSLADNGTLYCSEIIENNINSVNFNSTGIINVDSIIAKCCPNLYDMKIKSLDDGTQWARIFYHNNQTGTVYFSSTDDFENSEIIKDENRYSRLNILKNFIYDEKYELMACQPDNGNGVWRWTQTNNPVTSSSPGTVTFISGTSRWTNGLMRCNGSTFLAQSTTTNNWWCAIGCYGKYGNGLPGWGQVTVTGGLELWVRIDNLIQKSLQVYKDKVYVSRIEEC